MRTVVFINAHSRQAKSHLRAVRKFFNSPRSPFKIVDFIIVEDLNKFDEYIDQLTALKNLECVIVGSGDGTIVAVLNALKDRKDLRYGFLPLGTSNVFVRSLGLPIDIKKSFALLSAGKTAPVCLGSINGKLFANSAGTGVPSRVVANLTNKTKRYLGPLAYIVSGIREFIRHDAFECSIDTGTETITFHTHHLLIANGKYHGLVPVGHGASVFNDKLVVIAFGTTKNRWQYARTIATFGLSKRKHRDTFVMPLERMVLRTDPVREIEADGEPIGLAPAEVKIIKNAITVFTASPTQTAASKPRKNRR